MESLRNLRRELFEFVCCLSSRFSRQCRSVCACAMYSHILRAAAHAPLLAASGVECRGCSLKKAPPLSHASSLLSPGVVTKIEPVGIFPPALFFAHDSELKMFVFFQWCAYLIKLKLFFGHMGAVSQVKQLHVCTLVIFVIGITVFSGVIKHASKIN